MVGARRRRAPVRRCGRLRHGPGRAGAGPLRVRRRAACPGGDSAARTGDDHLLPGRPVQRQGHAPCTARAARSRRRRGGDVPAFHAGRAVFPPCASRYDGSGESRRRRQAALAVVSYRPRHDSLDRPPGRRVRRLRTEGRGGAQRRDENGRDQELAFRRHRRCGDSGQRRDPDRRHFRRRHRFSSRSSPRRPLCGCVRDPVSRRPNDPAGPGARRRVLQPEKNLSRGVVPGPLGKGRLLHPGRHESAQGVSALAARFCARRSSSRASPRGSACVAIRSFSSGVPTRASIMEPRPAPGSRRRATAS